MNYSIEGWSFKGVELVKSRISMYIAMNINDKLGKPGMFNLSRGALYISSRTRAF